MVIKSKEEKIEFLEKILQVAKENSKFIAKLEVEIFDADSHHVQEECSIGVKLNDSGSPYFTIHGTHAHNSNMITDPEKLLIAGERYLPAELNEFKRQFHLYKDYNNQIPEKDLINSIR
jgi:hypothetical protein